MTLPNLNDNAEPSTPENERPDSVARAILRNGVPFAASLILGILANYLSSLTNQYIFAIAGLVALGIGAFFTFRHELRTSGSGKDDPDSAMRGRIDEISKALKLSSKSLRQASDLLADLQEELSVRTVALEKIRQDISEHQQLAEISLEASKALDHLIDERVSQQAKRITRIAWAQGIVFALFGASVAVAVVIFSHLIPTIK